MNILPARIRDRLGPIWSAAALLFLATRFTDVVNAFTGIWLVPHYVSKDELGAVLPLTQVATVLALPLSIVLSPYAKLLNVHADRGETGKVKAMLRDASLLSLAVCLLALLLTPLFFPAIFAHFKIENGRLALAIVVSSILGALAPVFSESLRALRRFDTSALCNAVSGPFRLLCMAICLPFRGLTGYFTAQSAGSLMQTGIALGDFLRRHRGISCESYWKEDRSVFLAFCLPLLVLRVLMSVRSLREMLIMPLLPAIESAAYYQLTRFTEIASYLGAAIVFVLFPVVSGRSERGDDTLRLLRQSLLFIVLSSAVLTLGLTLFGGPLFSHIGFLRDYTPYARHFLPLGVIAMCQTGTSCFVTHRIACGRFSYVLYSSALALAEIVAIHVLLRVGVAWSLGRLIALMLSFHGTLFLCNLVHLFLLQRRAVAPAPAP